MHRSLAFGAECGILERRKLQRNGGRTMHDYKTLLRRAGAVLFWLAVWQAAAMAIGQEVFLVSPVQALRCLLRLLPQADFWHRVQLL